MAGALGNLGIFVAAGWWLGGLPPGWSAESSIGEEGIGATVLHGSPYYLLGRKIAIGQVELGRPGLFALDKVAGRHRVILPTGVFFRDQQAKANDYVDPHAQQVAGVMISQDKAFRGVAPQARLYASAIGLLERFGQAEECLTIQHIAQQNGGDVRAINLSFGESLLRDSRSVALLDGNALLTQCVDWSARVHDVLYVVAGNQGGGGIPIPTDNFNGLTVAFTRLWQGAFTKVDYANLGDPTSPLAAWTEGREHNAGPRRAIGLVAPGAQIGVINPDGSRDWGEGTSFAAPHVTATVALLQEWGDRHLQRSSLPPRESAWTPLSRKAMVMKAVLLNAADKLADPGNGLYLGMKHTILDKHNRTWLNSDAFVNDALPLHAQMGAGQLNAFRAFQQFQAGPWSPDQPVPLVGWDYRVVEGKADPGVFPQGDLTSHRDYRLGEPLQAGSFIAITLAWERWVDLVDGNQNGEFDLGETFQDRGLNNLDLYLMPLEEGETQRALCASISTVDSVEHLFCQVPTTAEYKIRVQFQRRVHQPRQAYALAWWGVPAGPTTIPRTLGKTQKLPQNTPQK